MQQNQKPKKIRVINPTGIYEYNKYSLSGRSTHVKVGQTLKVTQIRKYKYATRYRLTNGKYITANKKICSLFKYQVILKPAYLLKVSGFVFFNKGSPWEALIVSQNARKYFCVF
ncbi:DUF5776 domain-containing protein [Secundilactobacillus kimchicus]|uniref:DUF5776 domain-containing protein n=1 Tax=Secundilactobacillus kimchicus TaxID=528209 RepID=UPI0034E581C2